MAINQSKIASYRNCASMILEKNQKNQISILANQISILVNSKEHLIIAGGQSSFNCEDKVGNSVRYSQTLMNINRKWLFLGNYYEYKSQY